MPWVAKSVRASLGGAFDLLGKPYPIAVQEGAFAEGYSRDFVLANSRVLPGLLQRDHGVRVFEIGVRIPMPPHLQLDERLRTEPFLNRFQYLPPDGVVGGARAL